MAQMTISAYLGTLSPRSSGNISCEQLQLGSFLFLAGAEEGIPAGFLKAKRGSASNQLWAIWQVFDILGITVWQVFDILHITVISYDKMS